MQTKLILDVSELEERVAMLEKKVKELIALISALGA